jgi:catechol 2,3-dioxygenase-like lactoylglutathione lyase family enzyme
MSSNEMSSGDASGIASVTNVDTNLEVIVIPVSDVDRAKEFYGSLGWRLDADVAHGEDFRLIQFTPPGSGCSIQFGTGLSSAAPGSAQGLYLIVSDIEAARNELLAGGVEVSDVFHEGTPGARFIPQRTVASADLRPIATAMARSPRSVILTATAGYSRRSRRGYRAGSTRRSPPSRRPAIWRAHFVAPRPPTASTSSARVRPTRTGPTGTPRTWWRNRRARNCPRKRLRLLLHGSGVEDLGLPSAGRLRV